MTINQARTNPSGPTWDSTSAHRRAICAEADVRHLRALIERMQPVVDAAVTWNAGSTEDNPSPGRRLAEAVAEYVRQR